MSKRSIPNENTLTRFDLIKEMETPSELGNFLCDMFEECKICPVRAKCGADEFQGNGFTNYLKERVNEWRP